MDRNVRSLFFMFLLVAFNCDRDEKYGNEPKERGKRDQTKNAIQRDEKIENAERKAASQLNGSEIEKDIMKDSYHLFRKNSLGNGPIHEAVVEGKEDRLEFLIKKGGMINHINAEGKTPLELAFRKNDKKIVDILINSNVTIPMTIASNFLHQRDEEIKDTNELITFIKSKENSKQKYEYGDFEYIKNTILSNRIDLSAPISMNGKSEPLYGYLTKLDWLIDSDFLLSRVSNLNYREGPSCDPLYFAALVNLEEGDFHFKKVINCGFIDSVLNGNNNIYKSLLKASINENKFYNKAKTFLQYFKLSTKQSNGELLFLLADRNYYSSLDLLLRNMDDSSLINSLDKNSNSLLDRVLGIFESYPQEELLDEWYGKVDLMVLYLLKIAEAKSINMDNLVSFFNSTFANVEVVENNEELLTLFLTLLCQKGIDFNEEVEIEGGRTTLLIFLVEEVFEREEILLARVLSNFILSSEVEGNLKKNLNLEITYSSGNRASALEKAEEYYNSGFDDDELMDNITEIRDRIKALID